MSSRIQRIETLEVRRLLAAAIDPAAWDLLGTDSGDQITITCRASLAKPNQPARSKLRRFIIALRFFATRIEKPCIARDSASCVAASTTR